MDFDEIAEEIRTSSVALRDEVAALAKLFRDTQFLGDNRNFRHAHSGYLMSCMAQADVLSLCLYGRGEQTDRLRRLLDENFLYPGRAEEHRVAVQLMRHTLMHTGDMRPVYEKGTRVAYTWQINFGDWTRSKRQHYTIVPEKLAEQQTVIAAANGRLIDKVKSFNLQVDKFAADISSAAEEAITRLRNDPVGRKRCVEDIYPTLRFQTITEPQSTAPRPKRCNCA